MFRKLVSAFARSAEPSASSGSSAVIRRASSESSIRVWRMSSLITRRL